MLERFANALVWVSNGIFGLVALAWLIALLNQGDGVVMFFMLAIPAGLFCGAMHLVRYILVGPRR